MKNKIINIFTVIIINIIIFFCLLLFSNYIIDKQIRHIDNFILKNYVLKYFIIKKYKLDKIDIGKYATEEDKFILIKFSDEKYNKFCGEKRVEYGSEYKGHPIIVMGCSYAYGHGLKKEQTFSYLLSKLTKRPVYNFSNCGDQILGNFDKLKSFKDLKKLKNTDYIIYIYMYDHINRFLQTGILYQYYTDIFPIPQNSYTLKLLQIPTFKLTASLYQLNKILMGGGFNKNAYINNSKNLLKTIIIQTNKRLKEYAPNAQMIIIVYDQKIEKSNNPEKIAFCSEIQNSNIWEEIEKESDIKVVRTKDLTGFLFDKDYKLKEDISGWHPNEKAWEVLTPLFAKKYIN